MDMVVDTDWSISTFSPFLNLTIGKGLSFKTQVHTEDLNDFENFNFLSSIHINLGKTNIHVSEHLKRGIGYYNTKYKKKTIFNKPNKNTLKFIELDLSGLFIEENTARVPFAFGSNSLFSPPEAGQQLRLWINEIDLLAKNKNVAGLIINLGRVKAGFSKKEEMHDALLRFKESGKK